MRLKRLAKLGGGSGPSPTRSPGPGAGSAPAQATPPQQQQQPKPKPVVVNVAPPVASTSTSTSSARPITSLQPALAGPAKLSPTWEHDTVGSVLNVTLDVCGDIRVLRHGLYSHTHSYIFRENMLRRMDIALCG